MKTNIFIALYIINYYIISFLAKSVLVVLLPVLDAFTIFESIENHIKKRFNSVDNALENVKEVTKGSVYFDAINAADSGVFSCVLLFSSVFVSLLSLIFDWHFLWTLLFERIWLLILIYLLPSLIYCLIIDISSETDQEKAIQFVRCHTTKECIKFSARYLTFILTIFILEIVMLYIIYGIMQNKVSSYQAIEIFFNNLLNRLK